MMRAAPITPQILADIHDHLDLAKDKHLVFWAACLTGFFILARKSNLVPVKDFDPEKQLATKHVKLDEEKKKVEITLHWLKTRRPMQDPITYPLHKIPGSKICPFEVIKAMFEMIERGPEEPCFVLKDGSPLTYAQFQNLLCTTLNKAGYEAKQFLSHGLRAGGATWADQSGVPHEMIKLLGDWRSNAYLRYLENPTKSREAARLLMRETNCKARVVISCVFN